MKTYLLVAASAVALFGFAPAGADDAREVIASKTALTPEQEVQSPAVESAGKAVAVIGFDRYFRKAGIRVTFSNLEGEVSRLHLHCNVSGANGPIAIGAVDLVALGNDNSETVTLDANTIEGTLENSQFPAADACAGAIGRSIRNLRDLADAINDGQIYWNLHTFAFPAGELRGQVEALELVRVAGNDD